MANPLFQMFGNRNQNEQNSEPLFNGSYGNSGFGCGPFGMIQQFNQFRANFQGDPHQQVLNLLNSGRMTQEQFNQLSSMAQQFQQLIGRRY